MANNDVVTYDDPRALYDGATSKPVDHFTGIIAAIEAALAKHGDVLAAIREGRMQAAGAVIGSVMQAMKGSADAGRVRELIIEMANK